MQNIYSTQWIRIIKEILQGCELFINIWENQHNIHTCIEDSKAIRLLILELMINTSKLSTLVYLHTLHVDTHIMYYLKIAGNWSHIYMNYLPAI